MTQYLDPSAPLVDVEYLDFQYWEQTLWYISVGRNGGDDLDSAQGGKLVSCYLTWNQSDSRFRSYRWFDGKGSGDFGRRCHWRVRFCWD